MKHGITKLLINGLRLLGVPLAMVLAMASIAQAQTAIWTYIGADNGAWNTLTNWDPRPSYYPGNSYAPGNISSTGAVIINTDVTVKATGQVIFSGSATTSAQQGIFNAIELTNGGSIESSSAIVVRTADGAERNVYIGTGSSLISTSTGDNSLQIGSGYDGATSSSVWTVHGDVSTRQLCVYGTKTSANTAGLIMNIDGGSLTVTDRIKWIFNGYGTKTSEAKINLSNGGTASLGIMENATYSSNFGVVFMDMTGLFEFAYGTNYTTLTSVESLIASGFISHDAGLTGDFNIVDTGTGWQVTFIPEPSASVALLGLGALLLAIRRKRR